MSTNFLESELESESDADSPGSLREFVVPDEEDPYQTSDDEKLDFQFDMAMDREAHRDMALDRDALNCHRCKRPIAIHDEGWKYGSCPP